MYDEYKDNKRAIIFLDPPYVMHTTMTDYSSNMNFNIYTHMHSNPMKNNNAQIILCLEKVWVIDILFNDYKFIEYNKKYITYHRKTTHIIISNKPLKQITNK